MKEAPFKKGGSEKKNKHDPIKNRLEASSVKMSETVEIRSRRQTNLEKLNFWKNTKSVLLLSKFVRRSVMSFMIQIRFVVLACKHVALISFPVTLCYVTHLNFKLD